MHPRIQSHKASGQRRNGDGRISTADRQMEKLRIQKQRRSVMAHRQNHTVRPVTTPKRQKERTPCQTTQPTIDPSSIHSLICLPSLVSCRVHHPSTSKSHGGAQWHQKGRSVCGL
uniref:Uncharacterized protein n=1 Tax=Vitrella brassicaformis TaxID=1169539 RepID=A0A7S1JRZ2_9ALVE|mmetsp:Transcript_22119/g.54404  ORF Transcript_22119/g.54404 Transcript_22119/m.54404 type:complete len:115 (+) Transcript_22119:311-655(+)